MSDGASSGARPGLKRKLVRISLLLLALTGASALLGVAVVELSLAERQRAALETQIKRTLTTRGLSLTNGHAFVFRSLAVPSTSTKTLPTAPS